MVNARAAETEKILAAMKRDKAVRRAIVRRSFRFFFLFYFSHYMEHPFAPFHEVFFDLAQNDEHAMLVIAAFRGSAKSTIFSLAYVVWCVINGRSKFTLLISGNQYKAETLLNHIREELQKDGLLKRDLGPFRTEGTPWNTTAITIQNYGAKIMALSIEQSARGLRHVTHRPDLIVMDDCESEDTVRTLEARDKFSEHLGRDIIPAGHPKTKVVVIGSMLHPDSLIPRLLTGIDDGAINGLYCLFPILDEHGCSTWPGKYPDAAAIAAEKARGIGEREWFAEYMLVPPFDENQVIRPEHIHHYDRAPELRADSTYTGVDLAIRKGAHNDFTAMVSGVVVWENDEWYLDILPYPVNERLSGPEIIDRLKQYSAMLGNGVLTRMFIEDVAFQQFVIDYAQLAGIPVECVSPGTQDKLARLIAVSFWIQNGRVRFPRAGAEALLVQLKNFGAMRHDDLVDALVYLILKVVEKLEHGRVRVPAVAGPKPTPSRQEEEAWEDKGQRLRSEAERSGDPIKVQEWKQWQRENRQRRPEYQAERERFRNEMRRRRY